MSLEKLVIYLKNMYICIKRLNNQKRLIKVKYTLRWTILN